MKKLLSLLLMLTMSISIYAQDVIVKKDSTTIMAKVLTVGTTTVEYKKWSNQDGPTYVIEKTELLTINYANGEKEVFSEQKKAEMSPTVITHPKTHDSQNAINQVVSRMTNRNVSKKIAGQKKIIAGSLLIALLGAPFTAATITSMKEYGIETSSVLYMSWGLACTAGGAVLIKLGRNDKKEALGIIQTPILQHQFKIGDYALTPSVNVYSDKLTKQKGLDAGLAFSF